METIQYQTSKTFTVTEVGDIRLLENLVWNKNYNRNYYLLKPDLQSTNLKPKTRLKITVY